MCEKALRNKKKSQPIKLGKTCFSYFFNFSLLRVSLKFRLIRNKQQ